MDKKRTILLKNTIMLYCMTFSSYILGFIAVPYETRVLGLKSFGLLGVTYAVMTYFQLFIDFGFLLSATEEVSINRYDTKKLSKIMSAVTIIKLFLVLISLIIFYIIYSFVESWRDNLIFYLLNFLVVVLTSLIPNYLYRGLEIMEAITIRAVFVKVFFTIMLFVFIKEPDDVILIPILNIIGNFIALILVYMHLFTKLKIRFISCSFCEVKKYLKASSMFFISRIASTIYTASNTIILDLLSGGTMTAYYTSANQIISTAKMGLSPISDSLYPYMVQHRDFKLVRKILILIEPIIILGCIFVFIFAEPLCIWFFGKDYGETAPILRALLPIVAIILPSYIFGFPVLGAMGLNKYCNYSIFVGSFFHICILFILYFTGNLDIITLGVTTSITESIIFIYRLFIFFKNKKSFLNF